MTAKRSKTTSLRSGLLAAALLLVGSALLVWLSPEYISKDTARRLLGMMMGGMVVFYANTASKLLRPLTEIRCDAEKEQAMRRFTARSIVLGGLAYAAAYLIAPLGLADFLAIALLGSSVLVVVIRCVLWHKAAVPNA